MRIGLSYDLKECAAPLPGGPDDAAEEYDSPGTVAALARAIEGQGHTVVQLGGGADFLRRLLQNRPDFVFNIAEGRGTYRSREAQVPAVLEMLGVPYSGSDPLTLAVCLDKPLAKRLVAGAGIPTPAYAVVERLEDLAGPELAKLRYPLFIKPAWEGSSKGVRLASKLTSREQLAPAATAILEAYRQPALVEEFIEGDEYTVGLIGNAPAQVIGVMRILPKQPSPDFIYTVEVKRDWERLVDYECPPKVPAPLRRRLEGLALAAYRTLGVRDLARVDFRVDGAGTPFFLEVNPLPGLAPHYGDLPLLAQKMGWSYEGLIKAILAAAGERCKLPCAG
ncbi:MAG: ATP-grasp domain-containing protein [Dehalococcoidia bacterium]|nr:ATP-grasp domain-containing protein [Dehalococcoidia bacterium]